MIRAVLEAAAAGLAMALLMLPMIALYGLSIVLAAIAELARRRRSSET